MSFCSALFLLVILADAFCSGISPLFQRGVSVLLLMRAFLYSFTFSNSLYDLPVTSWFSLGMWIRATQLSQKLYLQGSLSAMINFASIFTKSSSLMEGEDREQHDDHRHHHACDEPYSGGGEAVEEYEEGNDSVL